MIYPAKEKINKIKDELNKIPKKILDKLSEDKSSIENADELRKWMKELKKR